MKLLSARVWPATQAGSSALTCRLLRGCRRRGAAGSAANSSAGRRGDCFMPNTARSYQPSAIARCTAMRRSSSDIGLHRRAHSRVAGSGASIANRSSARASPASPATRPSSAASERRLQRAQRVGQLQAVGGEPAVEARARARPRRTATAPAPALAERARAGAPRSTASANRRVASAPIFSIAASAAASSPRLIASRTRHSCSLSS